MISRVRNGLDISVFRKVIYQPAYNVYYLICLIIAAFGNPVVPEVYTYAKLSVGFNLTSSFPKNAPLMDFIHCTRSTESFNTFIFSFVLYWYSFIPCLNPTLISFIAVKKRKIS